VTLNRSASWSIRAQKQTTRRQNQIQKPPRIIYARTGLCVMLAQINKYSATCAKRLYQCPQFLNLVIAQRVTHREWKVCENCFRKGHKASQCKARACRYCKEKHNSLLHVENNRQTSVVTYSSFGKAQQNLLATAEILIRDAQDNWQQCRGLLDPGSQSNFIS
jgi:hypothetical protein